MCDNCGRTRKPSLDYMQVIFIVITIIMVYLTFKYNTGKLAYIISMMEIGGMILIYLAIISKELDNIEKENNELNKIKDDLKDLQEMVKLEKKNIDK